MRETGSILWLIGLVFLLLLGACGHEDASVDMGTLRVALTDASDHSFSDVVITLEEIRAVPAGKEATAVEDLPLIVAFDPPKKIHVLDLAYVQDLLGKTALPAGAYSQLRLVLKANTDPHNPANYVSLADDPDQLPISIDTPSAYQSGLKIVGQIDVVAGETSSVSLDFDPSRVIVESDNSRNWQFNSTGIRMVQAEEFLPTYGALAGKVAFEVFENGLVYDRPVTQARISAIPEDGTAETASTKVDAEDGTFRLILPPGAYELQISAEGFPQYSTTLPFVFDVLVGGDTAAGVLLLDPSPPIL